MSPKEKKKFRSMRAHRISIRRKIQKGESLISSMNQRGLDQFDKNNSTNIDEKPENQDPPDK